MKAPRDLEKGDIIELRWFDAVGNGGWTPSKEVSGDPAQIATIGAVYVVNKQAVTLIQSFDMTSDAIDNWITVPWVNVTALNVIAE